MESGVSAGTALLSPLAVDDVFRRQSVLEVQELLRQLQLQQAHDAEEVRTLIGIRYLSFLEGLPEISCMKSAAEEALQEAKEFGVRLRCLVAAVADEGSNSRKQSEEPHLQHEKQPNLILDELPLQHSTPLDDFLFARGMDSSTATFSSHQAALPPACLRLSSPARQREGEPQEQSVCLRNVQQNMLLQPSRVWEALRRRQFLEALRLILIESPRQTEAAKAAVQKLHRQQQQQQQHPQHQHLQQQQRTQQRQQPLIECQLEGCLALAHQTTLSVPSLISSVRALAVRQLASADLSLAFAADAAAAVTLIYLLDSQQAPQENPASTDDEVVASAAKWILGVFFSARAEALEAQGALAGRGGETRKAVVAASAASSAARTEGNMELAIDAAESLIVAFSSSLEGAALLFSPSAADAPGAVVGDEAVPATAGRRFAAVSAGEVTFGSRASSDCADVSWALQRLPKVFQLFDERTCSISSKHGKHCCCCTNKELCVTARLEAFADHWRGPLEIALCGLPNEGPWRSLRDVRTFWVTLMERLQTRRPQWCLSSGASLFVVGSTAERGVEGRGALGATSDLYGHLGTTQLLRALGKACAKTCVSISESCVRALPLFTLRKGDREVSGISISALKGKQWQEAFEKDVWHHLEDVDALFGGARDPDELRAALPLRAAVAASLLQSLAKCAAPLADAANAAARDAATEPKTDNSRRSDEGTSATLLEQARRVEWLFVACNVEAKYQDSEETTDCQRKLGSFVAEWMTVEEQQKEVDIHPIERQQQQAFSNEADDLTGSSTAVTDRVVSAATAAARLLAPYVCFSSLIGYVVGFWPFVREAVKELQASWGWQRRASANRFLEPSCSYLDISGGAMSLLLELSRCLIVTSRDLKLEDLSNAPLLCFALKAVTAEEVTAVAVAAFAEGANNSKAHLLQLLVDCELLAAALDAPPPLTCIHCRFDLPDAFPPLLGKAVEAAVGGRQSAEALSAAARQGRQSLEPSLKERLDRSLEKGFSASGSLLWALLHSSGSQTAAVSQTPTCGANTENTMMPTFLLPQERLPLLPVTPLPAFAPLLSSPERAEASYPPSSTNNGDAQEEKQQPPKEPVKQLHRLCLDDAVDSVSRGLQSWLKRGTFDAEGSASSSVNAGDVTFLGAGKRAATVSAAGSGLAEVWAKQMGQVSALIGQHVESVQSRASQTSVLHIGQRSWNGQASNLSASPANGPLSKGVVEASNTRS